jgi:hypothetical protein
MTAKTPPAPATTKTAIIQRLPTLFAPASIGTSAIGTTSSHAAALSEAATLTATRDAAATALDTAGKAHAKKPTAATKKALNAATEAYAEASKAMDTTKVVLTHADKSTAYLTRSAIGEKAGQSATLLVTGSDGIVSIIVATPHGYRALPFTEEASRYMHATSFAVLRASDTGGLSLYNAALNAGTTDTVCGTSPTKGTATLVGLLKSAGIIGESGDTALADVRARFMDAAGSIPSAIFDTMPAATQEAIRMSWLAAADKTGRYTLSEMTPSADETDTDYPGKVVKL